jgi:multicomponent Na+:H+ antiporter subunit D
MNEGRYWLFRFLEYDLIWGQVDKLSLCFGYVFVIMGLLGCIYALHLNNPVQHSAAFLHIGGALGVLFAGDLLTLFIFWELMAIGGVFLIWQPTKPGEKNKSLSAGFRYVFIHLIGGSCLLAGIILHFNQTGSLDFNILNAQPLHVGTMLILMGFLINAAVPPLSAWLSDAYPEATITGAVFLTAYTTKTAVYVLIRGFPGFEPLIWLGAIMALYGVIFAVLSNDIRRLLAYHIISQVGYMVCGIGLGTTIALNGSTAHAFCHILYKGLLFMGAGAVIYATSMRKLSDLSGLNLYKKMPFTLIFYMIGAFSISGVPLFNGFISKSIVISSAGFKGEPIIELLLTLASVGTFLSLGLKLPYFTWSGKPSSKPQDSNSEINKIPFNMLAAMGLASFLCVLIGCKPSLLYNLLPFSMNYEPYTADHIISAVQLLLFTGVGFWVLLDKVKGEPIIALDTDWFYRKGAGLFLWFCSKPLNGSRLGIQGAAGHLVNRVEKAFRIPIRNTSIGWGAWLVVSFLLLALVLILAKHNL